MSARCDRHLFGGPLVCVATGQHSTHTYQSTSGVAHAEKEEF